jgi:nicotinate dehydrogenase subunit A
MALVGAKAVPSCQLSLSRLGQAPVTTLEGLSENGKLHPVQQAFIDEQAAQCGFCTNGMILTTFALLWANPQPTDDQIRRALDGNLCRCGAHLRIIRAVKRAAELIAEAE